MKSARRLKIRANNKRRADDIAATMNMMQHVLDNGPQFEHRDGWANTERANNPQWMPHERRPIVGFQPNQ